MKGYAIEDMDARAAAALAYHRKYVAQSLEMYTARLVKRRELGAPTLAILGMGRAGKDTAAMYLGDTTELHYSGSSSNRLCRFVSHMVDLSEEQAFQERHNQRQFWIEAGHAIRRTDMTLLARIGLGHGDMAIGLRGLHEVYACRRDGIVDAMLWIDNHRAAVDPTVEFTASDCDLVIPNHGSHTEFYQKLDKLIELFRLPLKKRS